jgi:hypothetical protein
MWVSRAVLTAERFDRFEHHHGDLQLGVRHGR